ncbi:chaperone DnaJ-domain superfamily protein [Wolffia australiana]
MEEYQASRLASLNYKEIFGAVSACSIPFLDLPPAGDSRDFIISSPVDYLDVFGGADDRDFAISYEEIFSSQDFGAIDDNIRRSNNGDPVTLEETKVQVGSSSNGIPKDNESDSSRGSDDSKSKGNLVNGEKPSDLANDFIQGSATSEFQPHFINNVSPLSPQSCQKQPEEVQKASHMPFTSEINYHNHKQNSIENTKPAISDSDALKVKWQHFSSYSKEDTLFLKEISSSSDQPTKDVSGNEYLISATVKGANLDKNSVNSETFRENCEHVSSHYKDSSVSLKESNSSSGQRTENDVLVNEFVTETVKEINSGQPQNATQSPENGELPHQETDSQREKRHSRASSTNSFSSLDQTSSGVAFLKVSDISLKTQPSKVPPPNRPPPGRPPPKLGSEVRTSYHSFKAPILNEGASPSSVTAAASVAAMQEAMELAQARLRSAKVSLERKRSGLHNRWKFGSSEELSSMKLQEEKVGDAERCKSIGKGRTEQDLNSVRGEKGEWKVEEEFYEFVQGSSKFLDISKDSRTQVGSSTNSEKETKWSASKEAFICDLGEKNNLLEKAEKVVRKLGEKEEEEEEAEKMGKKLKEQEKKREKEKLELEERKRQLFEEEKREREKLEVDKRKKSQLEEEKREREKLLQEEMKRGKQKFEQEERERRLIEEEMKRERERKLLEEEKRERERKLLEEKKRERERRLLEEEEKKRERERRLLEEEKKREKERRLLEEEKKRERERRLLEEEEKKRERERRLLEEEEKKRESERRLLEEEEKKRERERRLLEEEEKKRERERRLLEEEKKREKERRLLEEEEKKRERERRLLEEEEKKRERERRLLEEEEKKRENERRLLEEEEKKRERERRLLEEEEKKRESERRLLEEEEKKRERERRLLEEEKKRERERKLIEEQEEKKREKLEKEERERRLLEEKEKERERQIREEEKREREKLKEEEKEKRRIKEEKEREEKKIKEEERERRRLEKEREREQMFQEDKERERRRLELEDQQERQRKLDDKESTKVNKEVSGNSQKVEPEGKKQEERVRGRWKIEEERMKFRKFEVVIEGREKQLEEEEETEDEEEREKRMLEEEREREREREKDRQAAERAAREANERAFAEARERADKAASMEKSLVNKARIRAEKSTLEGRIPGDNKLATSSASSVSEVGESAIRCKARMERHQRTVERAAKALAEKNMRDVIAQREQAERNRLAEALDAEIRRWSNGKEGNLRALLSTLQYILGPESGWQPIPLTEVLTAPAAKRAYRKATLCVHPDKLQQRGASIQHKYICEKVFDLLKEAWSKFNSEER